MQTKLPHLSPDANLLRATFSEQLRAERTEGDDVAHSPDSAGHVGANKRKGSSPTARSLKRLRDMGYLCAIVEHWNMFARIRQDLWGFVDILALKDGETLAVQTTSGSNVSARIAKIANHENIGAVRKAGWRVEVHGWRKLASGRWEVRVVDVS